MAYPGLVPIPPFDPANPAPLHVVMTYPLDPRQTIDQWVDAIRQRAEFLMMLGYDEFEFEEYRVRMLLFNLPLDPFWNHIRRRYPIVLEDGTWNLIYVYNGRWRLGLEDLRNSMAIDYVYLSRVLEHSTAAPGVPPPQHQAPAPAAPEPAPATPEEEDDCRIIFSYPARRRRSIEYELRRLRARMDRWWSKVWLGVTDLFFWVNDDVYARG